MTVKITVLILLILSTVEIFFNFFSKILKAIISKFNPNFQLGEKPKAALKLIVVAVLFASVIYYLVVGVKFFADLLGISLNQSIFDIF